MATLAARKKAKRLLAALGVPAGRANVVVREVGGKTTLTVRLIQGTRLKVRPTRFEGAEITYEHRDVPIVSGNRK